MAVSTGANAIGRRILIVDGDAGHARRLGAALSGSPLSGDCELVPSAAAATACLSREPFDAVVASLDGCADPLGTLQRLANLGEAPVIALSASGSVNLAVEAVRRGAADFMVKPVSPEMLARRLLARLAERPERVLPATEQDGFEGFIGTSPAMQGVYGQIARIAASRAPVFVTGASGTGKEVAAVAVHARSGRASAPFVALNCGAIPKDLMESEIFGHVRGAFTGAGEDRAGAAELADGGTLFLDEICEMELPLQAKLLRFVQTGEVRRVGGGTSRAVDVRFVCATNRDPRAEVEAGRFREDLFYRLHVLPLHMPPLRDRGEDVVLLARAFLSRFAAEERRLFQGFDAAAETLIRTHDWPGNVRELQNAVRRAVVMNEGVEVTAAMLAENLPVRPPAPRGVLAAAVGMIAPLWVQEQRIIEQALDAFGGNIAKAAAALEINPSTIYRKRQGWVRSAPAE